MHLLYIARLPHNLICILLIEEAMYNEYTTVFFTASVKITAGPCFVSRTIYLLIFMISFYTEVLSYSVTG